MDKSDLKEKFSLWNTIVHPLEPVSEVDFHFFFDFFKDSLNLLTPNVSFTNKKIKHATLLRPQFALAGYTDYFLEYAITLLGNTEVRFLNTLPKEQRRDAIMRLAQFNIPCIILTGGAMLDVELFSIFAEKGTPVFSTSTPTPVLSYQILDWLDDFFAPRATVHGNLVSVHDIGVLICGDSGVGKSEVTLDLIRIGHKIVADDLVIATRKWGNKIVGKPKNAKSISVEIRDTGIIEVDRLFGVSARLPEKEINLMITIQNVDIDQDENGEKFDRRTLYPSKFGMIERVFYILDVPIVTVDLFVKVGRYLTTLIEDVVLYHHSKNFEYDPKWKIETKSLPEQYQKR